MWTRTHWRLPILFGVLGLAAACAGLFLGAGALRKDCVPRVKVSPGMLTLTATADMAKPRGSFRLENVGGADLVLGPPTTTCTCTVVAIEPKTVPPGGSAVLTVEGRPPGAGRSEVLISVPVNTERGKLELHVDLVGRAVPPYVAYHLTAIRFGVVSAAGASERVFIETREKTDGPHWLLNPESTDKAVEVRGGFVREDDMGDGVVRRRYEYDARLIALPGDGEFQAEVRFPDRDAADSPVLVIPVHGIVVPPESERTESPGPGPPSGDDPGT